MRAALSLLVCLLLAGCFIVPHDVEPRIVSTDRPVDEGPMWRANANFKLRFDADGELAVVVDMGNVRCLGPRDKD